MRSIKTILLVIIGFAHMQAALSEAYIDSSLFAYSEPVTVDGAFKGWQGEFTGGETAFTHNRIETGIAGDDWKFGFIKRFDYELEFSAETAEFIHRLENRLPLESGRTYHLDLKARHSYSDGLRFSYELAPLESLGITVGASYLEGRRLTEGRLQGEATAISATDYDFEFAVDYFYSRDTLFDRQVPQPDGKGYSIDLQLSWQPIMDFTTTLTVRDLIGRIYWRNAPRTTAQATSDVKEYDEDGYVIYKPVLTGKESNENFTQHLPTKTIWLNTYRLRPRLSLVGRVYHTELNTLGQLGAQYNIGESTQLTCLYMLRTEAVTLGYQKGNFSLAVISDALKYSDAHTFGLDLSYILEF